MTLTDEEFLIPIYLECKKLGYSTNLGRFRFGEENSKDVKVVQTFYPDLSYKEILGLVKSCLAEKYFLHAELGSQFHVKLTDEGFDAAKEKHLKIQGYKSKNVFHKLSKTIDNHNGIFTLVTAIVAIAALLISIFK